jgi:hypothetical protein
MWRLKIHASNFNLREDCEDLVEELDFILYGLEVDGCCWKLRCCYKLGAFLNLVYVTTLIIIQNKIKYKNIVND